MPLNMAMPTLQRAWLRLERARLRPAAAGRINSALMSITPTHLMASMTATATNTTKRHSTTRECTPRVLAREALMEPSSR